MYSPRLLVYILEMAHDFAGVELGPIVRDAVPPALAILH